MDTRVTDARGPRTASPAAAIAGRTEALGDSIAAVRGAFEQALRAGDVSSMAGLYASDAMLVVPMTDVVHGRAAIERFWRTGIDSGVESAELTPIDVHSLGDVALEVGRYVIRMASDGGSVIDRGRYFVVHRATEGGWQRVAEMLSPETPPAVR
jgi:uncharacterized protein (TIGR02246 family)